MICDRDRHMAPLNRNGNDLPYCIRHKLLQFCLAGCAFEFRNRKESHAGACDAVSDPWASVLLRVRKFLMLGLPYAGDLRVVFRYRRERTSI